MAAGPFCDLTMAYNATTGLADLVFDGNGFPLDYTAQTALIISLGTERRADPDDVPPGTVNNADTYSGGSPSARRGCVLAALDPNGAFIGSRLWLLDDAKQTEETRVNAASYAAEAIAWIAALGVTTATSASWVRQNMLAILAQAGSLSLRLPISLV